MAHGSSVPRVLTPAECRASPRARQGDGCAEARCRCRIEHQLCRSCVRPRLPYQSIVARMTRPATTVLSPRTGRKPTDRLRRPRPPKRRLTVKPKMPAPPVIGQQTVPARKTFTVFSYGPFLAHEPRPEKSGSDHWYLVVLGRWPAAAAFHA